MSMERTNYVIVGYDFTKFKDRLYTREWYSNDDVREMREDYQRKGNVQVFSDPCSGNYLYFGYILSVDDEYSDSGTVKFGLSDLQDKKKLVDSKLKQVGWNIPIEPVPYEVICFTEYR